MIGNHETATRQLSKQVFVTKTDIREPSKEKYKLYIEGMKEAAEPAI
jgi:hypothetical protein